MADRGAPVARPRSPAPSRSGAGSPRPRHPRASAGTARAGRRSRSRRSSSVRSGGASSRIAHGGRPACPRQDSNLRFRLRRPALYPLSYGGCGCASLATPPAPFGARRLGMLGAMSGAASVLLVDDDPRSCRLLEVNFRLEGFEVDDGEPRRRGARASSRAPPDALRPRRDDARDGRPRGLRRLREEPALAALPVVFLTGRGRGRVEAYAGERVTVVTKPFDPMELVDDRARARSGAGRVIEGPAEAWLGEASRGGRPGARARAAVPRARAPAPTQKEHGDFATNVAMVALAKRGADPRATSRGDRRRRCPPRRSSRGPRSPGPASSTCGRPTSGSTTCCARSSHEGDALRRRPTDRPAGPGGVREREPDRAAHDRSCPQRRDRRRAGAAARVRRA